MTSSEKANILTIYKEYIDDMETYFGWKYPNQNLIDLITDLEKDLTEYKSGQMPKYVYARCLDGKVRRGKRSKGFGIEMLRARNALKIDKMDVKRWETILTEIDKKFAYCFENETFYSILYDNIGLYLMNHQCNSVMYEILSGELRLKVPYGLTAEVFDTFVKKDKSLSEKRELLVSSSDLGYDFSTVPKNLFSYFYISVAKRASDQADIASGKVKVMTPEDYKFFDLETRVLHTAMCYDIIKSDLDYRVVRGMNLEEAAKLGRAESKKYGFVFIHSDENYSVTHNGEIRHMKNMNYQFMQYMNYLANTEH